jgi:hypothetical protein
MIVRPLGTNRSFAKPARQCSRHPAPGEMDYYHLFA